MTSSVHYCYCCPLRPHIHTLKNPTNRRCTRHKLTLYDSEENILNIKGADLLTSSIKQRVKSVFHTYPSTVSPADGDLISSVGLTRSRDASRPIRAPLACFAGLFSERTGDERLGCFQKPNDERHTAVGYG